MKVAFNFHGTGLGNNGGTRSVLLSAVELSSLGLQVEIWSDTPSQFTWFKIPRDVSVIVGKEVPQEGADLVVATGAKSVASTLKSEGKGIYWIRAIETWATTEDELVQGYRSGLALAANATWMKKWIEEKAGVHCEIVRPGLEIGFFVPPAQKPTSPVFVGALYSPKPRKRSNDIWSAFCSLRKWYGDSVKLAILTNDDIPANFPYDVVAKRPTEEEKRAFYQSCDIWFAPTDNEGLHVPPMEAGLCGCALVSHGVPSAGMEDYALHEKTALVYPAGRLDKAVKMLCRLIDERFLRASLADNLRKHLISHIGSRTENMLSFVHRFCGTKARDDLGRRLKDEGRCPTDKELMLLNYTPVDEKQLLKLSMWPEKQIRPFLALMEKMEIRPSERFLEMGCRTGAFLSLLRKNGWNDVQGVDICEPFVNIAVRGGLPVIKADVCRTGLPDGQYAVVYSRHVMEHVPDPIAMLKEQLRLLRPGGVCVNQFPVGEPSAKHLSLSSGDDELLRWLDTVAGKGLENVFYGDSGIVGFVPMGHEKTLVVRKK